MMAQISTEHTANHVTINYLYWYYEELPANQY
jgi:hypothetical protein